MNLLSGRVAVITGVNSGIGRETAKLFAQNGANVVGVDVRTDRMQELEAAVIEAGSEFLGCHCDVRSEDDVKLVLEQAVERFGKVDILINVAGVSTSLPITHTTEEEFERVIDINLKGVFNFCKHATKYFKKQRHGVIVNTSSVTGIYGSGIGCPYPASKAAVIGLTKSLAMELSSWNIRVNAVAPGVVDTEMVASLDERAKKTFSESIPLGRMGKAEDVAEAIVFLASKHAAYITGAVLCVDGGYRPANVRPN